MSKKTSSSSFPEWLWRRLADSVSVEPVLVLFALSQGIYMITAQTVYINKVPLLVYYLFAESFSFIRRR